MRKRTEKGMEICSTESYPHVKYASWVRWAEEAEEEFLPPLKNRNLRHQILVN